MIAGAPLPVRQDDWTARKRVVRMADGRPLAVVDTGGSGPAVLLLHGYTDSSRSFSLLDPWLGGYRLIIPDLPGHGGSGIGAGLGIDDLADDIAALIRVLRLPPLTIIGHSMGAMIGMVLAARLPETVTALVTISGSLRPAFPPTDPVTAAITGLVDPIDPADPFFDLWHAGPHPVDRSFLAHVRSEAASIPAATWHGILDEFSTLDLTPTAASVTVPVLCIGGDSDGLFDASHRLALEQAFPRARSIAMEGFGHNPHWEDAERIAAMIREFLADSDMFRRMQI